MTGRVDVEVNIDPALQRDHTVVITHRWDVPEGFRMSGPANYDGPCRLVVDVETVTPATGDRDPGPPIVDRLRRLRVANPGLPAAVLAAMEHAETAIGERDRTIIELTEQVDETRDAARAFILGEGFPLS